MISKKRPVPSNATLRILYQLAYVSSGTLAGFATLCAEERRRRAKIVQKVADNAQRLRQSPRYYQNVAASISHVEPAFFHNDCFQEEDQPWARQSPYNGLAAKSSTLPSAVEKNYTQLGRPVQTRRRGRRLPTITVETQTRPVDDAKRARPARTSKRTLQDGRTKPTARIEGSTPASIATAFNASPRAQSQSLESIQSQDRMRRLRETASRGNVSKDRLQTVIHTYMTEARAQPTMEQFDLRTIGSFLLQQAAKYCMFPWLRSLVSLQLSRDALSTENVQHLCDNARHFFASAEHQTVLEFYDNFFAVLYPTKIKQIAQADLIRMAVDVFISALAVTPPLHVDPQTVKTRLLDRFVEKSHNISAMLWQRCREGLATAEVHSAVQVFLALKPTDFPSEEFAVMSKHVFAAALRERSLLSAALILRLLDHPKRQSVLPALCEEFLQACDTDQSYALVMELFLHRKQHLKHCDLGLLSSKADEIIAYAHVKQGQTDDFTRRRFELALDRVPANMRQRISRHGSQYSLHLLWRRTRNLSLIREEYSRSLALLKRLHQPQAVSSIRLAMSEILVSAGSIDQALAILLEDKTKNPRAHGQATLVAATILAKTAPLATVVQFLDTAKASGLLQLTGENSARFNALIKLLSKRLALKSLFKFTAKAVDSYGFAPDAATTEILIKASVWQRDLDLLLPWYKFVILRNHKMHFGVNLAVGALREFHISYRPSPNELLGMIMRILRGAQRLADGSAYLDLFKSAVAWHVGQLTTKDRRQDAIFWQKRLISRLENGVQSSTKHNPQNTANPNRHHVKDNTSYSLTQIPTAYDLATGQGLHGDYMELQNEHVGRSKRLTREPDPFRTKDHEASMLLALASDQYAEVLRLYRAGLDQNSWPSSVLALRLAVDASIKANDGQTEQARQLLAEAKAAGFHIPAAMTPAALAQIRALPEDQWKEPLRIRNLLVRHYRENARQGVRSSPHLANTAAHILIRKHQPSGSVNLLRAIFQAEWPDKPEMDMATMTIFFKAYAAMDHWQGMQWVIDTVFDRRMFVTKKFHQELGSKAQELRKRLGPQSDQHERVQSWIAQSLHQRMKQRDEAAKFGHELANKMIALANVLDYAEDVKTVRIRRVKSLVRDPVSGERSSSLSSSGTVDMGDVMMRPLPLSVQ